jgi:hypothetical protein
LVSFAGTVCPEKTSSAEITRMERNLYIAASGSVFFRGTIGTTGLHTNHGHRCQEKPAAGFHPGRFPSLLTPGGNPV